MNIDQIIATVNAEAARIRDASTPSANSTTPHSIRKLAATELSAKLNGYFSGTSAKGGRAASLSNLPALQMQAPFAPNANKHYHLNDLTRYHGDTFLQVAYRALLGRAPDPVGNTHFQALLLQGIDKSEIIVRLMRAEEAKRYGATVDGLAGATVKAIVGRIPVVGNLFRWALAFTKLPQLVARQNSTEAFNANQDSAIANHINRLVK